MRQPTRRFALALATSLVAVPVAAHAQSVDRVVSRAEAAWAKVRTLRGDFEQTVANPLTGANVTVKGVVEQRRPDRLSVRFENGDRIVADGKALWIYLPSTVPGQVMKESLSGGGTGGVDLTAQFLDAPRKRFNITDAGSGEVGGRPAHALTLVPKARGSAPFAKATVWVDDTDGLVRKFDVTDANGLTRHVRLTSIQVNVPVPASDFVFSVPEGARVVDRTGR